MVLRVLDNKVREEEADTEVGHWLVGCAEIKVNV